MVAKKSPNAKVILLEWRYDMRNFHASFNLVSTKIIPFILALIEIVKKKRLKRFFLSFIV